MDVLFERCCGLDIHKKTVVACLLLPGPDAQPIKHIRTFSTMTDDLLALADWLTANQVTHVAFESTGVYWKPIYNLLEGSFVLLLVNAQHIKTVPGRKTDVKDAEWIATLLRHGLLKASFVPEREQRELRELTRYRTSLVRERSAEVNRLQKTLEGANIKLACVASDILGVSARQMLSELVAGESDATALAQFAKGKLRDKLPELERALRGQFRDHQRFLVARQMAHIDHLELLIAEVSSEVKQRLGEDGEPPKQSGEGSEEGEAPPEAGGEGSAKQEEAMRAAEAVRLLDSIPGVGERTAEILVAEIGLEMGRFATAGHLASWAGMCPGQRESGGKRKSGKTRKGSPWLRAALVEAAHAASRVKESYLAAQYHRVAARRGVKKAAVAVGHSILVIAYHLLKRQTTYEELGGSYFDERERKGVERRAVKKLEGLGYKVTLEAAAVA